MQVSVSVTFDPEKESFGDAIAQLYVKGETAANTKAAKAGKGKGKGKGKETEEEPTEEQAEDEPEGPDRDEVRAKLKEHAAIEGKESAIKILNDTGGASSIGELKEDKFQAVIDACDA